MSILDDFTVFIKTLFGMLIPSRDTPSSTADTSSETVKRMNLADELMGRLPDHLAQFSDAFASAANAHASLGMTPLDFALVHAAVINREAFYLSGQWALRPRGPDGTGDPVPRWYLEIKVPSWAYEFGLVNGNTRYNEQGFVEMEVVPPAFAGAQFPGWGYGLGQIDFVTWRGWLSQNNWKDPFINLDKSATILSDALDKTGSVRYGVAAYNAGVARILTAKKMNADPDGFTSGGNYASSVLAQAVSYGFPESATV